MEKHQDALAELAALLGVDAGQLLVAAGEPWTAVEESETESDQDPEVDGTDGYAPLFVGRVGPSVAIKVNRSAHAVVVGPCAGNWDGVVSLRWSVGEPHGVLGIPSTSPGHADFLDQLRAAIDLAARIKASTRVLCQYCGTLTFPEHALDSQTCHGCASTVLGVVY